MTRKVIINICPTGMIPNKQINSHTPLTPEEIGRDVATCAQMGASIVHVHPRDEAGVPTWKPDIFKRIVDEIRNLNEEILISATTSGRLWEDFDKRSALLELTGDYKPDLASLTLGSNNFAKTASINRPIMIKDLAQKMRDNGIKPELEVFELGMLHTATHFMEKGYLDKEKPYFNILFNSPGTAPFSAAALAAFLSLLPEKAIWSVGGIGANHLPPKIASLVFGGHIRVGIEDSPQIMDGENKISPSNDELLFSVVDIMHCLRLSPASVEETKDMLGLS